MQYIEATSNQFARYVKDNNLKLVFFASGAVCKTYVPYILQKYNLVDRVLFIVDNNPTKQGKKVLIGDRFINILSPSQLSICKEDFCVIITNGDFYPVMKQLDEIENCNNRECFIAAIMQLERKYNRSEHAVWKDYENPQIPKIIHYCWFSGNPMPKPLQECINTWKENCPDFEIVCWNENNFDINKYRYTKEAHDLKKWGFIPDVVRLEILYEVGGFYFDTDVKIIKNLEELRYQKTFCGRERAGHVNFGGGSGSIPHSPIVKEILDFRKNEIFSLGQGRYNAEASGYYETYPLMKQGLMIEDINQKLDGINVYASEFFSPYNYINGDNIQNENTFSIHYFSGSWIEGGDSMRKETRIKYNTVKNDLRKLRYND